MPSAAQGILYFVNEKLASNLQAGGLNVWSEIEETKAQVAAVRNMNDQAQQQAAQFETTLHQRWQHVEDQIHMRESHVDPNLINQELQVVQRPTEASLQQQQQTASSQA